jgi:lytic cellulose monooxygenase (C1-hydroxylating)
MHALSLLPIVMGLLSTANAHGYVDKIIVGGQTYEAWKVFSDPYVTPTPVRYNRRIQDNGPVPNFEGPDITCNVGGNVPTNNTIPVTAGSQVYGRQYPTR